MKVEPCPCENEIADFFAARNFENSRRFSAGHEYSTQPLHNLLAALGQPQKSFRSVHIAGTVAKGSMTHILAEMLRARGESTAAYSSPHLLLLNERMQIDGQMISHQELCALWEKIRPLCSLHPVSYFDALTAMAFLWFSEKKVQWAVIETGLGGRLDSTNNLEPQFCLITPIDYDHQQILGNTLAEIAAEKAGIIKPGGRVYSFPQAPEAAAVLEKTASQLSAELVFIPVAGQDEDFIAQNLRAAAFVYEHYFSQPAPVVHYHLPGRLEKLSPQIYFDSAHNAAACRLLADWLARHHEDKNWRLYVNGMMERDLCSLLEIFAPLPEQGVRLAFYLFPMSQLGEKGYFTPAGLAGCLAAERLGFQYPDPAATRALLASDVHSHLVFGSMYIYRHLQEMLP